MRDLLEKMEVLPNSAQTDSVEDWSSLQQNIITPKLAETEMCFFLSRIGMHSTHSEILF